MVRRGISDEEMLPAEISSDPTDAATLLSHPRFELCGFPQLSAELRPCAMSIESQFLDLDASLTARRRTLSVENGLLSIDEAADVSVFTFLFL
jgi:hypothetical protein